MHTFPCWSSLRPRTLWVIIASITFLMFHCCVFGAGAKRATEVSISGEQFFINGSPTYSNRYWNGKKIEGLLFNSRMVQGVFEDLNPETRHRWVYPDAQTFDPNRNTAEFLSAMPEWRRHGLLAFTINLQGGSPEGYSKEQPWHNSAFREDGSLRPEYLNRLSQILDRADTLGMAVILGYFYFGQDERFQDEAAVLRAVDNATRWVVTNGWKHLLIEINNECNVRYDHDILKPARVHELIQRVKNFPRPGRRLLVGTSYGGGTIPQENVVRTSDFLLLHGNGVSDPAKISEMVRQTRAVPGYRAMPILFNEDDHFDFENPINNMVAAINEYSSWGYFDPGKNNYLDGYQSPPVNWTINTDRKKSFFGFLRAITQTPAAPSKPRQESANAAADVTTNAGAETYLIRTNYLGWTDSFLLGNKVVEVVVVPTIGRVMQFRFAGESTGPFWENSTLGGKLPDAQSTEWGNFGGDKSWPAPQAEWPRLTPRSWPPPPAFDSMSVEAVLSAHAVTLVSQIDPYYGIRVFRQIELMPGRLVMRIITTYEKVRGGIHKVGIWIITQLKEPAAVFMPLGARPGQSNLFLLQSKEPPPDLKTNRLGLWFQRSKKTSHKIGNEASTLVWVGEKESLRIDSPRLINREYPDGGSSAEIYTNPDPLPYVELEMLGPLQELGVGEKFSQTNFYTLFRRQARDPIAEAERILK